MYFRLIDPIVFGFFFQVKVETSGDVSVLFLSNVGPHSSGNYTCVPQNARPSNIRIHVLKGKKNYTAIKN